MLDGERRQEVQYDHVISGTGYRMDIERLAFLSSDIRRALTVAGGAPVLSRSFESTVPNLYFIGAMAGPSLGPNMRFLSGTHFMARRLTHRLRTHAGPGQQAAASSCVDLSTPVNVA